MAASLFPEERSDEGPGVDLCPSNLSAPRLPRLLTSFGEQVVRRYTPKEVPQPQVVLALGLLKTKPLPFRPPEYSRIVPARKT